MRPASALCPQMGRTWLITAPHQLVRWTGEEEKEAEEIVAEQKSVEIGFVCFVSLEKRWRTAQEDSKYSLSSSERKVSALRVGMCHILLL